jgi:hypothetical protein
MQSEVTRFHIAMFTNDHVKQDHARLFTLDPIGRIEERRTAMLADPSHTRKFSKDNAIAIRRTVPFPQGEVFVSLKKPCLGCEVIKRFVKIDVGIGHTANGRKLLSKVHKKRAVHQRVRWETEQNGAELCKEWSDKQGAERDCRSFL